MCLFAVSVVMKPAPGSDYSQQDSSPVSILTVSILVFALIPLTPNIHIQILQTDLYILP